jgi:hypothetical protein
MCEYKFERGKVVFKKICRALLRLRRARIVWN